MTDVVFALTDDVLPLRTTSSRERIAVALFCERVELCRETEKRRGGGVWGFSHCYGMIMFCRIMLDIQAGRRTSANLKRIHVSTQVRVWLLACLSFSRTDTSCTLPVPLLHAFNTRDTVALSPAESRIRETCMTRLIYIIRYTRIPVVDSSTQQ